MPIRTKFLLVLWVAIAALSGVFAFVIFNTHETEYLEGVDGKLLTAATMAKSTLPDGYHDQIVGKQSVSTDDYLRIVDTYNKIALETGLQYIWSVMVLDGKVHFTTGTSTSKDVKNGDHALFFDVHQDPDAFAGVLEKGSAEYSTFENQWGHGRMVLIPDVDAQGRIIIFGASISIDDLAIRTADSLFNSALIFIVILVAGTAVSIALSRTITRPITKLTDVAKKIAAGDLEQKAMIGGGEELVSLSSSINTMAEAIKARIEELETKKHELEAARDTLEERVEERTIDLQKEIEERIKAEEDLRKLSRVVSQSPVMVFITDTNGTIEYVNPRFEEMTGYSADEANGQNPRIIKSPSTPPSVHKAMWKAISAGDAWHGEIEDRRKDGTFFWAIATISPVRNREGVITHYVALHEDISDRKKTEAALHVAKEQAEKANRAKSDFLSSMSHELRTPLNGILGFAQLLEFRQDTALSKQQSIYIDHILTAGNHLLSLINEVLDLSKIESGGFALTIETVDPLPEIEECLNIVTPIANARGIKLVNRIAEKSGFPMIRADAGRFRQILVNLVSNAIKYNRADGLVTLDCRASPEQTSVLRFMITDTGPGIPKEKIPELFQPFNRLGAEAGDVEGSGIGLTITQTLIAHMDGRIGVDSTLGAGSTFWFEIPIASIEEIAVAQQEEKEAPQDSEEIAIVDGTHTVLYVEDNPRNLDLMVDILSHFENVTMLSAKCATEGLDIARSHAPDAIIMDINLPDMDGFTALNEIQKIETVRDIPVIALSASAMPKDITRGIKAGFQTYLTKPLDIPKMLRALNVALKSNLPPN